MGLLKRIKQRFAKPALPVIVVGTDIASYQLTEQLLQSKRFSPLFMLNEEPWHHKTTILGVQLRYASELLALVERHNIVAVLCVTPEDLARISKEYEQALIQQGCKLVMLKRGELPDENLR